jgi:hypothetical protein
MWATVLFLGFGLSIDPLRLGLVVVLVSRRRPMPNLFAFWVGGMVAGVGLGMAVLLLFREIALTAIDSAASTISDVRSSVVIFTGGRLQITLGVLMLLVVAHLVARQRARARMRVGDASVLAQEPRPPSIWARLANRNRDMLQSGFVWPAFLVGLGSATPPLECVMVLTVIMASGAAATTQLSAFVVFTLLVLSGIEIPLVTYLAMPQKTEAAMLRLNNWLCVNRRLILQTTLAATGVVLVVKGLGSL